MVWWCKLQFACDPNVSHAFIYNVVPTWPHVIPTWPHVIPTCPHVVPKWTHVIPTWPHVVPTWPHVIPTCQHVVPTCPHVFPTWPHVIPTWPHVVPTCPHVVPTWPHAVCICTFNSLVLGFVLVQHVSRLTTDFFNQLSEHLGGILGCVITIFNEVVHILSLFGGGWMICHF